MPRKKLSLLQSNRLKEGLYRLAKLPFYKTVFSQNNIDISTVKSINDLNKLPFTTKENLQNYYPYQMFATPMNQVVELHTSSGTTGKPTVTGYTQADITLWANMTARALAATGVTASTIIQNSYNYGLTTGGPGFQYGAQLIGATVLPTSSANTATQLALMQDLATNLLLTTPSYALTLNEAIEKEKINIHQTKLQAIIFGAEAWSVAVQEKIERNWGISVFNTYGLSEIIGPGVAHECQFKNGLHLYEDHFFPEVIDPVTLESVKPGQIGELVITAITKQALPIIRYRTKDLVRLNYAPCDCGRTLVRMSPVIGRIDQSIIVNEKEVHLNQIEHIVVKQPELYDVFAVQLNKNQKYSQLNVQAEAKIEYLQSKELKINLLEKLNCIAIRDTGISINWQLVPPQSLPRSKGKAQRIYFT